MSIPGEGDAPPDVPVHNGGHLLRGSLWMLASRWAMRMLGLISTLVLVRLLAPEDFGLVAMIMLAYGLLETISYAGVDLALLRETNASRDHYDTAWTLQILQGCFIAVLLLLSAPWVADYFSEPRVTNLIGWVALRAVIDGTTNIGVVQFRKQLDFAREFRYNVLTKIASVVVVVVAALWFRNYWALIVGSLVASATGVAISYLVHPYRPRLSFAKARGIWSFSQWLIVARVGSFLNRKCDEFVVGGHAGTALMGSYHVANEIATMPSTEIVMPIRRAMFPNLARLIERPQEFADAVVSSFSAVAVACLFVGACLAATAPEFVAVVLGTKWLDAVPVLRWLAIFGALSALVLVLEVPLWVSGRTRTSAIQTWFELALIAPLAWFAVLRFGVEGAAAARVLVVVAMVPLMMYLCSAIECVSVPRLLATLWRPALAALAMVAASALLPEAWTSGLVVLVAKLAVCALAFPVALLALWALSGKPDGIERQVLDYCSARLLKPARKR